MTRRQEIWAAVAVLLLGLLPRYLVVSLFPTEPVSDFRHFLSFARELRTTGLADGLPNAWAWRAAGMPSLLAVVWALIPVDLDDLARFATATVTGVTPLVAWLMLRGVGPIQMRLAATALLLLWQAQILTSGVVSSVNWTVPFCVALALLATRCWAKQRSAPLWGAGLLGVLAWIRPELLVAGAPLAAMAAWAEPGRRRRDTVLAGALLCALLLASAGQRYLGSGHVRLGPPTSGLSFLGGAFPDVFPQDWIDPRGFIACHESERLAGENDSDFGWRLGRAEVARRPLYHAVRAGHSLARSWWWAENGGTYWSFRANLLPEEAQPRAAALTAWAGRLSDYTLVITYVSALTALGLAVLLRSPPMLAVAAAVLLKAALHLVFSATPRYFVVASALELVLISLAVGELVGPARARARAVAAPLAVVAALTLWLAAEAKSRANVYLGLNTEVLAGCVVSPPVPAPDGP